MNAQSVLNTPFSVAKFGGTSVADHAAMERCIDIILADPSVRVVVLSASSGVTNLLVELSSDKLSDAQRQQVLLQIEHIQTNILAALGRPPEVSEALEMLLSEMREHSALIASDGSQPQRTDQLLSIGERCSTLLFTEILRQRGEQACCCDVRQVLRTDSRFGKAAPQIEDIAQLAKTHWGAILTEQRIITQGFIGADQNGQTTTLGRGGSDYSAALLAEALGASELAIWTDVDGIYTCDPRVVTTARPIPELSFDEAAEMAAFGAKVLHPATILPAVRSGCAVFVGCSREPEKGGTWIKKETERCPTYRALSLRRDQTLLTVRSLNMLHAQGFLAELFSILARHHISVDLITTSEVSVALTLDSTGSDSGGRELLTAELLAELETMCAVEIDHGLTLIAVIGNDIADTSGIGKQVFDVMEHYNVRMICQGASSHNLCFLVEAEQADEVVRRLHRQLLD